MCVKGKSFSFSETAFLFLESLRTWLSETMYLQNVLCEKVIIWDFIFFWSSIPVQLNELLLWQHLSVTLSPVFVHSLLGTRAVPHSRVLNEPTAHTAIKLWNLVRAWRILCTHNSRTSRGRGEETWLIRATRYWRIPTLALRLCTSYRWMKISFSPSDGWTIHFKDRDRKKVGDHPFNLYKHKSEALKVILDREVEVSTILLSATLQQNAAGVGYWVSGSRWSLLRSRASERPQLKTSAQDLSFCEVPGYFF